MLFDADRRANVLHCQSPTGQGSAPNNTCPDARRSRRGRAEALALAARHEGLLLDPVYTGKAMAGLVAHARAGRIATGSRVLFMRCTSLR